MPQLSELIASPHLMLRILAVIAVAIAAHIAVRGVNRLSRRAQRAGLRTGSGKALTIVSLASSAMVLAIWFSAVGLLLTEAGLDLKTYFASATIIGLAVGFGSQGIVQDIVTGLTLVLSDLIDVGDLVEISGQTGVVTSVGMRFVALTNYMGATVYVPNRTINNVVSYPKGYVRALIDVRLPQDAELAEQVATQTRSIVRSAYEQFPGISLAPPGEGERRSTEPGTTYLRVKLRIWPGQTAPLDGLKAELVETLKATDPSMTAWKVALTLETEAKELVVGRR